MSEDKGMDGLILGGAGAAPSAADALLKLAERCEREGPSLGLDIGIECAAFGAEQLTHEYPMSIQAIYKVQKDGQLYNPPNYTKFIDMALTLVPEHWAWFVEWIGKPHTEGQARLWIPSTRTQGLKDERALAEAKTPALALCAAALRARAALITDGAPAAAGLGQAAPKSSSKEDDR